MKDNENMRKDKSPAWLADTSALMPPSPRKFWSSPVPNDYLFALGLRSDWSSFPASHSLRSWPLRYRPSMNEFFRQGRQCGTPTMMPSQRFRGLRKEARVRLLELIPSYESRFGSPIWEQAQQRERKSTAQDQHYHSILDLCWNISEGYDYILTIVKLY